MNLEIKLGKKEDGEWYGEYIHVHLDKIEQPFRDYQEKYRRKPSVEHFKVGLNWFNLLKIHPSYSLEVLGNGKTSEYIEIFQITVQITIDWNIDPDSLHIKLL